MRFLRGVVILVCLVCFHQSGWCQPYRFITKKYSVEEGLPHRMVYCVIQDQKGFIWGGTPSGLFRFDGRRFKIYNRSENGLAEDLVSWIAEDSEGNIWIGWLGPKPWFDILNPVTGKVTHSTDFFKKAPLPVPLEKISEDLPQRLQDGTLVISLSDYSGWMTYHHQRGWKVVRTKHWDLLALCQATEGGTVWGICKDQQSRQRAVAAFDTNGILQNQYRLDSESICLSITGSSSRSKYFYCRDIDKIKGTSILKISKDGSSFERLDPPTAKLLTPFYTELENGNLKVEFPWIFDQEGRVLFDLNTKYPELDEAQHRGYCFDKDGNICFATTFGLLIVEVHGDYFQRLLYQADAPGGRGVPCRGIIENKGQLFVNSEQFDGGSRVLDLKSGVVKRLPGTFSIGLAKSAEGGYWTDLEMEGWNNVSIGKFNWDGTVLNRPKSWQRDWAGVWLFLEASPQRLLLMHLNGISIFNPQTGEHSPWPVDPQFPEFSTSQLNYLGFDPKGRLWACTTLGLYELNPAGGVLGRYWPEGQGKFYLPYWNILHFYCDADNVLWLGTKGGGLIRWDGENAMQFQRKSGLLNNVVYAVYEDRHQHLWAPTDYGIVQFDKKNLQVRSTWLTSDGITNNEFNRISHYRDDAGVLYFGGLNGITAFDPELFYSNNRSPQQKDLLLSDAQVMNGSSGQLENRMSELLQNGHITICPDDLYLQLDFSLLELVEQNKVIYSWKMDGISDDWQTLAEPVLRISGLKSGQHRLFIRAQSVNGSMAKNELDLKLMVLPPFYLRWWFILLELVLIAGAIWFWLRWRERSQRNIQKRLEVEVTRQTDTIRQQAEELRRLDESKSRFFANVSHELRTPLTLIIGPVGSILKNNQLPAKERSLIELAHRHGTHLLELVNALLDLSKMESGKMTLNERPVQLYSFVRRLVSAFESHAEWLGIRFVFEYQAPQRIKILADEDKLQKVLNNLLSNALKFTPPRNNGLVSVRVEQVENHIRISVTDTGRGIPSNDLPRIFERFYQTSQENAPVEGGTGIGLALCREIAQLMQGRIWAESELGKGSRFYFEFPIKEVLGSEAEVSEPDQETVTDPLLAPSNAAAVPLGAQSAGRILLVEDNPSLRSYIEFILREKYEVFAVENGLLALQLMEKQTPDLILSDIMMPEMDGFQLLEKLKSDPSRRHIPVVMLTARADVQDKLRALRIGVDDYLLKPFEEEELLARIGNLLQNARNRSLIPNPGNENGAAEPSAEEETSQVSTEDLEWLARLEKLVCDSIGDSILSIDWLATKMFTGRNLFFKRVKSLTGLTPNEYLQTVRMACAREMLEQRKVGAVKEVAYKVGFRDVKYFSEQYFKYFGKLPSSYL
ncbi:MAG: response regulator [Saprospiraceae bacterium]|nr:response regulator [Saprospiraceae bacterium]